MNADRLRAALRYIRNVIITEKVVKYPDRAEADRFFNYPYAAIEEALANAVYHKAYDEREPIEVRVTSDKIEIISHPGPDRSVTLQGLKEFKVYSRRYRKYRAEILHSLQEYHIKKRTWKKIAMFIAQLICFCRCSGVWGCPQQAEKAKLVHVCLACHFCISGPRCTACCY